MTPWSQHVVSVSRSEFFRSFLKGFDGWSDQGHGCPVILMNDLSELHIAFLQLPFCKQLQWSMSQARTTVRKSVVILCRSQLSWTLDATDSIYKCASVMLNWANIVSVLTAWTQLLQSSGQSWHISRNIIIDENMLGSVTVTSVNLS